MELHSSLTFEECLPFADPDLWLHLHYWMASTTIAAQNALATATKIVRLMWDPIGYLFV
jgi:hypothetical protein